MAKTLKRKAQALSIDDYLSPEVDLPEKLELIEGEIGPFSDAAKLALLANWGADTIVALTGPQVWREAIAAIDRER